MIIGKAIWKIQTCSTKLKDYVSISKCLKLDAFSITKCWEAQTQITMKNFTTSKVSEQDFYYFLMEESLMRTIGLSSSFVQACVCPIFFLGIIWFERYGFDKKRNLINMMISAICWTVIEFR